MPAITLWGEENTVTGHVEYCKENRIYSLKMLNKEVVMEYSLFRIMIYDTASCLRVDVYSLITHNFKFPPLRS